MSVTVLAIVTSVIFLQLSAKEKSPILVTPSSIITVLISEAYNIHGTFAESS